MNGLQLALPGLLADSVEWVWSDFDEVVDVKRYEHSTVMRDELVRALAPSAGGVYVDATLGGGGHTIALLEAEPRARVIAFDRDRRALDATAQHLAPVADRVSFVHTPFSRVVDELAERGIAHIDGLMADLGVSSPQLDDPDRGMSFRREGPIDMRMDPETGLTALDVIERSSDEQLADLIFNYGEERRSRRIARSVKKAFSGGELRTTLDLRRAIVRAVGPARIGGVDPATRTFQALRIAVNDELAELRRLLDAAPGIVRCGGRVAILSFHSLEDRTVKRSFASGPWAPLNKKPIVPGDEECARNPRARSAKLRVAERVSGGGAAREEREPR
jgi:16S rRNA (cytosine1402-N4)-methyltransferase